MESSKHKYIFYLGAQLTMHPTCV